MARYGIWICTANSTQPQTDLVQPGLDRQHHLYGFISFTFYTELPAFRWPKHGTKKTGKGAGSPDKRALRRATAHGH
jgi:hypothetical protein